MFDQFMKKMRETDHRFLNSQGRISMASTASLSTLLKQTNRSASVVTSRFPLRRQQTTDTDAVLTGRWKGPPPLTAKQASSPGPRVAWASSPLAKPQQAFQFVGLSAETPRAATSVEPPQVATAVEPLKAAISLAVVEEDVDTEAAMQESQDGQVTTQATELSDGYYLTSDGFLEAEV